MAEDLLPLYNILGSSADNVFAVGTGGTTYHFDGSEWRRMKNVADKGLYGIWGSSAENVYAVGVVGSVYRYDGNEWISLGSFGKENLSDIWGLREQLFIVGGFGTIRQITLE